MIDHEHWLEAQEEEADWWGDCANTFHEEEKQMVYAKYMRIPFYADHQSPYNIAGNNKNIVDIGGGPSSLLLKVKGADELAVFDPCDYPEWVSKRYAECGIDFYPLAGECIGDLAFVPHEVWIYNVLQHTEYPDQIIRNALNELPPGGTFRIFEWIDTPVNTAHPQCLTQHMLNEWIDAEGHVTTLAERGCFGKAYSCVKVML